MRRIVFTPIARHISSRFMQALPQALHLQEKLLQRLLEAGSKTAYGKAYGLDQVKNYADFRKAVPLINYEQLKPWIDRIAAGEPDVLWPGRPTYFALSSGTTSGVKHIPVTPDSLRCFLRGNLQNTANFTTRLGLSSVHSGNFILFSDSHIFVNHGDIPSAAISAIASSVLPWYVRNFDYPSVETQQIKSYDEKVTAMIRETVGKRITGIVALPPWLMLFLQRVPEITGKSFSEVYPDFHLLCTSGMRFEPYRQLAEKLIGKPFDVLQAYPASEGFFGFQLNLDSTDMVLLPDNGVFYEFVREDEFANANPARIGLGEVEVGVRYILVISTIAGLWGYMPGDVVEFTSLNPHLIQVAGRIGSILNQFGEHLTVSECEEGIVAIAKQLNCPVVDFALHAVHGSDKEKPYHEWFVAFDAPDAPAEKFATLLDAWLVKKSLCYRDLIDGNAMQPLQIKMMQPDAFEKAMEKKGKIGTQQKTVRFLNEADAEVLRAFEMSVNTSQSI